MNESVFAPDVGNIENAVACSAQSFYRDNRFLLSNSIVHPVVEFGEKLRRADWASQYVLDDPVLEPFNTHLQDDGRGMVESKAGTNDAAPLIFPFLALFQARINS